jgi:hypothetical protein
MIQSSGDGEQSEIVWTCEGTSLVADGVSPAIGIPINCPCNRHLAQGWNLEVQMCHVKTPRYESDSDSDESVHFDPYTQQRWTTRGKLLTIQHGRSDIAIQEVPCREGNLICVEALLEALLGELP